jgi:hypothetical protein
MKYCCEKYKWFDDHVLSIFDGNTIQHMDDEEFFCCKIKLIYCPFCGSKLE